MQKPTIKPNNPCFSSGPCAKRPGWSLSALSGVLSGRSHRASAPKARLKAVIDLHKSLLGIPDDYVVGIVPASDTGAVEMALWSMLGARGVDVFAWESFGKTWLKDITEELNLDDVREFEAAYGALPDLSQAAFDRDVIFTWNGTTSGVRVPNADWISPTRTGLTICDATSAVFAYDIDWSKLDVTTWSWQKVLGSEGAHGMIVLSPRAVERLETYTPPRPLPKIFRMTKGGKLINGIFTGATINTPSMLAVEDCYDALNWVSDIGGQAATIKRSHSNFQAISDYVDKTDWLDFLADVPETRSTTSVCLKIIDPWFTALSPDAATSLIGEMCKHIESEHAGYDIESYRDAPPGLRIWCGATVETSDVQALLPWIEYAYEMAKSEVQEKAA